MDWNAFKGGRMKERNLEYEKKFRAYLFSGCKDRFNLICKNINVRVEEWATTE